MRNTAFNKCYTKRTELENFIFTEVEKEIKHFCKQYNYEFVSGNGTAFFINKDKDTIENKRTEKFLEKFWELGDAYTGRAPWTGWYNGWLDKITYHWTLDPWKALR